MHTLFTTNYKDIITNLYGTDHKDCSSSLYPVHDYLTSAWSDNNIETIAGHIYNHFAATDRKGEYNVLVAPCGTGKTYTLTNTLIPETHKLFDYHLSDQYIIPVIAVPNRVQISQLRQETRDNIECAYYNGDSGTKISLVYDSIKRDYFDAYNLWVGTHEPRPNPEDYAAKYGRKYKTILSVYDKCNEIVDIADDDDYSHMLLIIDEAHELLQARDYRRSAIDSLGYLSYNIVQNGGMVIYMTGTPSCLAGGAPYSYGQDNQYSQIWEFIPVEEELNSRNYKAYTQELTVRDQLNAAQNIVIRQQDSDPLRSIENSCDHIGLSRTDEICANLATQIIKEIRAGYKPFIRFNNIKLTRDIIHVIRRMGYNAVSVDSTQKTLTDDIETGAENYTNVIYDHVIRYSALPFADNKGNEIYAYFTTSLLDTGTNINGIMRNEKLVCDNDAQKITPLYVTARPEDFSIDNMTQFFSRLRFQHAKNIIYVFGEKTEYENRYRTVGEIMDTNKRIAERFIDGLKHIDTPDDSVRSTYIGLHRQADTPPYVVQVGNVDRSTKRVIDNAILYYDSYLKYQRQYFYGSKVDLEHYLSDIFPRIVVEDRRLDMGIVSEYQEAKEQMHVDITETCNKQMDTFFFNENKSKQNDQFIQLMNGKLDEGSNYLKTLTDADSKFADPIKLATRSIIAFGSKDVDLRREEVENLKHFIAEGQKACTEHINAYHVARMIDLIISAYEDDRQIKEALFDLAKCDYNLHYSKDSKANNRSAKRDELIGLLVDRQIKQHLPNDVKGTFVETANDKDLWTYLFTAVFDHPRMIAALQLINITVYSAYDEEANNDRMTIKYALTIAKTQNKEKIYRLIHAYEMASFTADHKMILADCTVSGFEYQFLTSERAFNVAGFKVHRGDYGLGRWIGKKITPDIADKLAEALTQAVKSANIMRKQKYFRRDIYSFFASTFQCERSGMAYQGESKGVTVLRITGVWRCKSDIQIPDANFILNMSARTPKALTEEGASKLYRTLTPT